MYIYIYMFDYQKSNTTLGPKFYRQLAPSVKLTFWGRTAKSSQLPESSRRDLSILLGPKAVGATFENGNAWICILRMSEKNSFSENDRYLSPKADVEKELIIYIYIYMFIYIYIY